MALLRWGEGPRRRGCVYHTQGIHRLETDTLVADVFIMPAIVAKRPIAVTIGRYRNYRSVSKQQWQLRDPTNTAGIAGHVSEMFAQVGAPAALCPGLGAEVERHVAHEAATLKRVLESVNQSRKRSNG